MILLVYLPISADMAREGEERLDSDRAVRTNCVKYKMRCYQLKQAIERARAFDAYGHFKIA